MSSTLRVLTHNPGLILVRTAIVGSRALQIHTATTLLLICIVSSNALSLMVLLVAGDAPDSTLFFVVLRWMEMPFDTAVELRIHVLHILERMMYYRP